MCTRKHTSLAAHCFGACVLLAMQAFGQCAFEPDAPDCPCFSLHGDWDPSGATIQAVALQTIDTQVSCTDAVADGGQPYYQFVLGCNSETEALVMSSLIWAFGVIGTEIAHEREAWCSETISYWHREAGIPYATGYRTWWHGDWENYNVSSLKAWYQTEEIFAWLALSGRGRWIEWHELDYEHFELGVTVPVPGAYIAIRGFELAPPSWQSTSTSHSVMVDEMWVHRNFLGNVFKIEVSLLQGNSGSPARVRDGHWDDLLAITPGGHDWIGDDRKIYGFGIDLNEDGQPRYDSTRLHYVDHKVTIGPPAILQPTDAEDADWNRYFAGMVADLSAYGEVAGRQGGSQVRSSSRVVPVESIPDGREPSWEFPAPLPEPVEITIDLLALHPVPVRGVELSWTGGAVPVNYRVQYAVVEGQYRDASVPDLSNLPLPGFLDPSVPIPVMVPFTQDAVGVKIRAVKLSFATNSFRVPGALRNFRYIYDWGPWHDAEENPMEGVFLRGDANADAAVDIGDAITTLGYLFGRERPPRCLDAADANDDGQTDIGDAIYTLTYLFARGAPPPAPGPRRCGVDKTADLLGCAAFPPCR